jgi:hypothetical protein
VYGARDRIKREAHSLAVQHTDGETSKGSPNAWWATDLRRGQRHIYGGLLRFIEHLHRRNVSLETALLIPQWLEAFIRELWTGDRPNEQSAEVRRAA